MKFSKLVTIAALTAVAVADGSFGSGSRIRKSESAVKPQWIQAPTCPPSRLAYLVNELKQRQEAAASMSPSTYRERALRPLIAADQRLRLLRLFESSSGRREDQSPRESLVDQLRPPESKEDWRDGEKRRATFDALWESFKQPVCGSDEVSREEVDKAFSERLAMSLEDELSLLEVEGENPENDWTLVEADGWSFDDDDLMELISPDEEERETQPEASEDVYELAWQLFQALLDELIREV